MVEVEFILNDTPVAVLVHEDESLLDTLRERLGITTLKDGCQPQGQCGACLTLIDGKPKVSCATKTKRIAGKRVTTLEGIGDERREIAARSFVSAAGLQCGFCTPGLTLRAHALLDKDPSPSREKIARAIDGHLCRCTGYSKVIDAVELMAKARRGEGLPEPVALGGVGASLERFRGAELVLGERPFVADLRPEGMLYGAVVLSEHARALVTRIDTAEALARPGVLRVLTWRDIPGERWHGLIERDWPVFVAEDKRAAESGAALVTVDAQPLPPVLSPDAALAPGAPQVNPHHENLLGRTLFGIGDVDEALALSAHTASAVFQTQRIEHLFLEPESALALPTPEGGVHLYTQGQGIFDDRRQVARILGLDEAQVFVELVPNGGAFGGKEDLSIQPHAALAALITQRPVRVTLTREQSIRLHPKRHPIRLDYTVGCDAEGHITAVRAHLLGDSGAYASVGAKVLERAAGHACGPYRVPAAEVLALATYTNNPPSGAMRGFGANQAAFAMESCLDMLAERVGLDPWELRWRNAVELGDRLVTGQLLEKSVGIKATLQAVKGAYDEARAEGRAVGVACGIKNSGIGNGAVEWGRVRLVVEGADRVALYLGYTEMGQGLLTICQQMASEVTALPAAVFEPRVDSTYEVGCGQTTGSRATLFAGGALIVAAQELRAALDAGEALTALVGRVFSGEVCVDDTVAPGPGVVDPKVHTTYGFATQVCVLDEAGRLERVIAAHDVGRAINPELCVGQIQGAVHMGLGFALTEELPTKGGMPVSFKLREIGVLRARDTPPVDVILVEDPEPEGPFGAKGVGEIGLVPTAGAVANALARYDGVRRFTLPMKDSPAARAIHVGRLRGDRQEWH